MKLPKEHGAWAMLYVPFLIGILVAGRVSLPVLLLLLAVSCLFIARESLLPWWRARRRGQRADAARRMMLIYLTLAALFGAPLLFYFHLWKLVWLGVPVLILLAVNAEQATRREDRTILGEILAIIGLTTTAPAAHYVAGGAWQPTALWLWALNAFYFTSSVFYVRWRVLSAHARHAEEREQIKWHCALYHSFLVVALGVLALTGNISLFVLLAFAPAVGRAFWYLLRPTAALSLPRIGVLEIVYSTIFLVLVWLAYARS
ncbi:MAG: YwiC-like family protein [Acidobacteriota bacterium]|nr:YwiC-like family protein [Acidobacteriota bacterium]